MRGQVAPLISVGVGFHHELTGRENVYVNGAVLGMNREQIDARFDEIVDFSEVEAFIDTPVKFYSSGMLVRLGFSVAVAANPEVLLVDEVLAVGDLAFQMKCYKRMEEIRQSGATIVMVSHNLGAIRNLCPRTVVLHYGTMRHDGDTSEAIRLFHDLLAEQRELDEGEPADPGVEKVDLVARFGAVQLLSPGGAPLTSHLETGDEVTIQAEVTFRPRRRGPGLRHRRVHGVGGSSSIRTAPVEGGAGPGGLAGAVRRPPSDLRSTGPYEIHLSMRSVKVPALLARSPQSLRVFISGRNRVQGVADLGADLRVEGDRVRRVRLTPSRRARRQVASARGADDRFCHGADQPRSHDGGLPRVGAACAWFDPDDPRMWSGVPRALIDELRRLGVYAGHRDGTPWAACVRLPVHPGRRARRVPVRTNRSKQLSADG